MCACVYICICVLALVQITSCDGIKAVENIIIQYSNLPDIMYTKVPE